MDAKTIGLAVAGVVAAGVIAAGGAALASSGSSSTTASTTSTQSAQGNQNSMGGAQGGMVPGGMQGTEITGSDAAKVIAAVKAKDSVTADKVLKLTDGSYLALTMQNGTPAMYKVSSDLGTVTLQQPPSGGAAGATGGMASGVGGGMAGGMAGGTAPQPGSTTATN